MININRFVYMIFKIMEKLNHLFIRLKVPCKFLKLYNNVFFNLIKKRLYIYLNRVYNNQKESSSYIGWYNSEIIWIFWWQGYNNMPKLVNKCIKSVKKNANGHKVILLDKFNLNKYTNIPHIIYKKFLKKEISFSNFSDIIRFNLLYNYGGLWCDATIYCTSKLEDNYFNYLYTSGGYNNTSPYFVKGKWTEFLIGGNKHNALFKFIYDYLILYWMYNKYQIYYFLTDVGLYYAYNHNIGGFKRYVDNIACNHNPNLFKLINYINYPYEYYLYKYFTSNTNMFKLTYKKKFIKKDYTFYHHLIG